MRPAVVCAAVVLLAGACGGGEEATQAMVEVQPVQAVTSTTTGSPIPGPPLRDASPPPPRPPILVRGEGRELTLSPWTACWSGPSSSVCADGRPPENPPDIGGPAELEVEFAVPDWRFTATAAPTGVECGREQTVDLEATGATTHRLVPIGPAGDYTITLSGWAKAGAGQRGDVHTTFRWHTPRPGPNEAPKATASIIGGLPSAPVSYGVEVSARALGVSTQKGKVGASVVVTSANGASTSIDLEPRPVGDCVPEGSLYLGASEDMGKEAAKLGPAPFRYDVTLVLDSIPYRGTGTWPDDQMSECSPCTALHFTPPLPAR